jgi:long-chain acyl-CoA synthetase
VRATRSGSQIIGTWCVNSYLTAEEVAYIVDNSESKVLITSATKLPVARDALAMCPKVTLMLVVDLPGAEDDPRIVDYATAIAEMPTEPIPDESLGVAMLYSSGTTGRPKGIIRPLPEQPPAEPLPVAAFMIELWRCREDMIYLPTNKPIARSDIARVKSEKLGGRSRSD